ncbi:MAG TPA: glycosyltransferase family 4 protein, partial [Bellilinea sp.]|nr:glycosyltransferase family 4 protein [Bellilinea sp.]
HTLPLGECDAFLYTSSSDGMPNVLIEAMAHGLPVVASVVGGIGDLVSDETGWPVRDVDDVDAYCSALRQLLDGAEDTRARARAGLALVSERHSFRAFAKNVEAIPGYGLGGLAPQFLGAKLGTEREKSG